MNRSKNFFYNTLFAAFYQVIVLLAGFIVPRYMLQYYGSEINGLLTSITQFITYFNLVEAGLSGAAVYSLYKPLAEKDHKEISSIITATQRFYIVSGYIFLSLIVVLALLYPFFVQVTGLGYIEIFILVFVLGFSGILEFFTLGKYRALLTADQKLYVISFSSILYVILNTAIVIVLSILHTDIVYLKLVALSSILLRSFILYYYTKKNYPYINYKEPPNNHALDKRWDALYLQILGAIHTGAPVILATVFTNLKEVSVYSIYNMVIGGISGVVGIFTNGLSSSFGDVIARKQKLVLQKTYQEFEFAYYSLIALIYGVSFVMLMPFIRLYTQGIKDTNYDIPILGFLFVLNALLYNLKTPQGMLVISAGHYKETRVQTTIQGLIEVLGGMILAPKYGLKGILIGAILSNLYRDIDLYVYVPTKITGLPIKNTIKRILCVGIEVVAICGISFLWEPHCESYVDWVKAAALVTFYAVAVIFIIGSIFCKKELTGVLARIKGIVNVMK